MHQVVSLICFFLHLSVGPPRLCAVDGSEAPQTEREWRLAALKVGNKKTCHCHAQPPPPHLVSCRNSLMAILVFLCFNLPLPFVALKAIIRFQLFSKLVPGLPTRRNRCYSWKVLPVLNNELIVSTSCKKRPVPMIETNRSQIESLC